MLGLVIRNLRACQEKLKETAYNSLVRPQTEYAAAAWDPYLKKNKKDIERIQRRAARFVKSKYERSKGTVTRLLKELEWQTLEERRKNIRLTLMYKISNNLIDIPSDRYLTPATRLSRLNNSKSYLHHSTRLNLHKQSFFPRTIPEWNRLPEETVKSKNLEVFKTNIKYQ